MKQSLDYFIQNRPEQYEAAKELAKKMFTFNNGKPTKILQNQFVALWASLKWGKREVLDILPLLCSDVEFIYLSPPHKSLKTQRSELLSYGWKIDDKKDLIIKSYNSNKLYVVAFDEADWGDGVAQNFDARFKKIKDKNNVVLLGISATNFTFLYNLEKSFDKNCVIGKKNPIYCGLEQFPINIVNEGPFAKDGSFTPTFEKIIREWLKATLNPHQTDKLKFIVRDTRFSLLLEDKVKIKLEALCQEECNDKGIDLVIVNQEHGFSWKKHNDDVWRSTGRTLFIVKQTFTRGTETDIQKFLYGYYDYRKENTALNTIAQALGRFPNYNNVTDINLYISKEHKDYVDIYLEIEDEIYKGNTLSSVFEKSNNRINYSAKLKKTAEKSGSFSTKWDYDFENHILTNYPPDLDKYVPSITFDTKTTSESRDKIIRAINSNGNSDGRWNKDDKYGKQATNAYVIFSGLTQELYSDVEKQFLKDKGILKHFSDFKYVIVKASPLKHVWNYDLQNYEVFDTELDLESFFAKNDFHSVTIDKDGKDHKISGNTNHTYIAHIRGKRQATTWSGLAANPSTAYIRIKPSVLEVITDLPSFTSALNTNIVSKLKEGKFIAIKGTKHIITVNDNSKYNDTSAYPEIVSN